MFSGSHLAALEGNCSSSTAVNASCKESSKPVPKTKTSSLRSACCSWLCCSGTSFSSSSRNNGEQQHNRRSGQEGCLRSNGAPSSSSSYHSVYEVASTDLKPGTQTPVIVNHNSCAVTAANNNNMKNGRKISPISSDLPPSLRHSQAAVFRQKLSIMNEPYAATSKPYFNDLKTTKAGQCSTTSVVANSADNANIADFRRVLGGGRLDSFQNKLADFWSNGLLSGNRRVKNMRQASHKFSLEQQPHRDEARAVLANRGTRSLPTTCRPEVQSSSLLTSIADCLKLAVSSAALERALEMVETEEEHEAKSTGYYFDSQHQLLHSSTSRQVTLPPTVPTPNSKSSRASKTTLTTVLPVGLAQCNSPEDNDSESPAPLPSFFYILRESLPQEDVRPGGSPKLVTRISITSVSIDEKPSSQPSSSSPNFMHDPSTVLHKKEECSGGVLLQVVPPQSGQLLVSSPPVSGTGKRKVSLMPLVTEDDLRRSNMGHKDLVAQVFGEDFASKFCALPVAPARAMTSSGVVSGPPAHSPLPYDCKEKMLRRRLSPENTRLPFEIRDESVPEGVPTVKVRRKPMSLSLVKDGSRAGASVSPPATCSTSYEDVAVALSPVQLKFPSLPSSIFNSPADNLLFPSVSVSDPSPSTKPDFGDLGVDLDTAANHPDMIHLQQVLNDWIKKQSKVLGSAFLLVSSEHNTTYCQVCGSVLMEEPVNLGDSNLLTKLFIKYYQPDNSLEDQPAEVAPVLDLAKVLSDQQKEKTLPLLSSKLQRLLHQLSSRSAQVATPDCQVAASLIGIRAKCGFVAALLLAHSSSQWEELNEILPHIPVLSTLMSIVANVEEQKRLAHQSQVFLSMTQNVFSSLLNSFPARSELVGVLYKEVRNKDSRSQQVQTIDEPKKRNNSHLEKHPLPKHP